jgi:diacylglycerol kinase (ATP)
MRTCVILNPAAGRAKAGQQRGEIERLLRQYEVEFELVTTHARGGATELTYQAIERGISQVVAIGGDGTINEVVNGIMGSRRSTEVALGIVPIGTGSDFVKALPGFMRGGLAGAIRRISTRRLRPIDCARIEVEAGGQRIKRYFINGLGMGLDAAVAVESVKLTRLKGLSVYLVAVFRALRSYRSGEMRVCYDDQELQKVLFMASVGNGRCQGGGFWMTPQAELDDGLLDLCMIDQLGWGKVLRYIPLLMRGRHTRLEVVTMGRARRIEVTCPSPFPVATDGEVVATDARRVVVETLPGSVQLIV